MGVRHSYQSATPNDPGSEISSARWNDEHRISGVIALLQPGSSFQAGITFGAAWFVTGTKSTPGRLTTSALGAMQRSAYTTAATPNNSAGEYSSDVVWRGNASGLGGFSFYCQFGVVTYLSDMQILVGLSASATGLGGEPSARNDTIGIGKDAGDSNWHLIFRSNSATTKIDLGVAVAAGQIVNISIDCSPNSSSMTVRVERVDEPAVLVNSVDYSENLPRDSVFLSAYLQCRTTQSASCAIASNIIAVLPGRL